MPPTLGAYDAWTCGAAIGLAAAAAMVQFAQWGEWANFLTGQWVAVAPWLLDFSSNVAARQVHVAVGLAVAGLAGFAICLAEYRLQASNADGTQVAETTIGVPSTQGLSGRRSPRDSRNGSVAQAKIIPLAMARAQLMKKRASVRKQGDEAPADRSCRSPR